MVDKQRQELPEGLRIEVDDLMRRWGELERAGDFEAAEGFGLQAWAQLPEPKLGWEFYSNIIPKNHLFFYRDTKQFDKALHWLDVTRESYGPGRNEVIEFYAATLFFEMGDLDKAFDEFDRQYRSFKTRPFQGEDRKFLDFYLSRRKR